MSDIKPNDKKFIIHYDQDRYDDDPRNGGWYAHKNLIALFNKEGLDSLLCDEHVTAIHSVEEVLQTSIVSDRKVLAWMKRKAEEDQEQKELEEKIKGAEEAEKEARKEKEDLKKQLKRKKP
jgi:hypothetical protein